MYKKSYDINDYTVKSFLEYYFALWLNELQEADYVARWTYEDKTFDLYDGLKLPYKKQMKTKVVDKDEHILSKASYTEDFCIYWTDKSKNIFYLDPNEPIECKTSDIPFRLGDYNKLEELVSYVDVKSTNASTTSSSVSQPYKSKWTQEKHGVLIHKIYPFTLSAKDVSKTLFYKTFYPKQVIKEEVYKRDCKYGKKGQSKIKHKYKLLNEFLNDIRL